MPERRSRFHTCLPLVAALLVAGLLTPDRVAAQAVEKEEIQTVRQVELVSPRIDGPPVVVLSISSGKIRPASGTYRSRDGNALLVKDGQILELRGMEARDPGLRITGIEQVAVRMADSPDRLVVKDARGRSAVLPDGRFLSADGHTLVVEGGTIVAYGIDR